VHQEGARRILGGEDRVKRGADALTALYREARRLVQYHANFVFKKDLYTLQGSASSRIFLYFFRPISKALTSKYTFSPM
jgi:hypothetical protein